MKRRVSAQKPKKATRRVHLLAASAWTKTSGYMKTAKPLASTKTKTAAMMVSCSSRRSRRSSSWRLMVAIRVSTQGREGQRPKKRFGACWQWWRGEMLGAIVSRYWRGGKDNGPSPTTLWVKSGPSKLGVRGVTPGGNGDGCENKGIAGKARMKKGAVPSFASGSGRISESNGY